MSMGEGSREHITFDVHFLARGRAGSWEVVRKSDRITRAHLNAAEGGGKPGGGTGLTYAYGS